MIKVKANKQPKWYNLRWKLSNMFVSLARKIYPENPDVTAFYMQQMIDQMIYGRAVVRVNPEEMYDFGENHV